MKTNIYILSFLAFIFWNCAQTQKNNKTQLDLNSDLHIIENDILKVSIKTKGAELSSIKRNEKEYLWQGDTLFWHEQSPILFPIVGKLKDNEFTYNDSTYKMKFHGFGRSQNFNVIEKNENSITFQLEDSEMTKKEYPFEFKLQIKYTLDNNGLIVSYKIENPSSTEAMYFSIGAHPGFNCPLEDNHKRNEYQLVFDNAAKPKSFDKSGGLFNDKHTQYFNESGILMLEDTIFKRGALVFNPNPFSKATLVHKPTKKAYLSVSFKGFPYLGVWSSRKNNTPFICVEPWYGMADFSTHNKDLTQKKGIQRIGSNGEFNCSYKIEIL